MTGNFPLDWAAQAVSLFNSILLLWLGMTVLLNAESRRPGMWAAGGMLVLGAFFFLVHSVLLGQGADFFNRSLDLWWRLGWFPVVSLPFAWYALMLWYAGYWSDRQNRLRLRHRGWLRIAALTAALIVVMLFLANPLPSISQLALLDLTATPTIGGVPLLVLAYPVYIVLCILLAVDGLLHPAPSGRMMGDVARQRARPWLIAGTFVQLAASLLVGWIMLWLIYAARSHNFDAVISSTVAWFDLAIAGLIGVAVVLVGQAIVSYEIFTGKALPRRGLRRQWSRAILLAAGFAGVTSFGLTYPLHPIYTALLSTLVVTAFYALLGWRSYSERESYMQNLRPFVASQRLYEQLLTPAQAQPEVDAHLPFRALCGGLLNARRAYLVPLGPLSPLAGPPLVYPPDAAESPPDPGKLAAHFPSPFSLCIALEPAQHSGAAWGVPLWSERGLLGALLLSEKRDGGLYTQEEIEIARSVGERLVDTLAGAEMARRLMALQRQRLAETQVMDRQARRILHDDVLPRLHAALLELSAGPSGDPAAVIGALTGIHRQISDLLHDMPRTTAPEVSRLGLLGALRQVVEGELRGAFDALEWNISPGAEERARQASPLAAEVLFYAAREALRNAARHAHPADPAAPLMIRITANGSESLVLSIEDNGSGMPVSEPSHGAGAPGQGLILHSTMMAVVGGALAVESTPGASTRVTLSLPLDPPPGASTDQAL